MIQFHSLQMNGTEIRTAAQFCTCFSPGDFLRNREMAAIFAGARLKNLSSWHTYHSTILLYAVLDWKEFSGNLNFPEAPVTERYQHMKLARAVTDMNVCDMMGENIYKMDCVDDWIRENSSTLHAVWNIAAETSLPEEEKNQLFFILAAGYFLANKTPEECPVTAREAEDAFNRKPITETREPVTEGNEKRFPVREEPWTLKAMQEKLPKGEKIKIFRLRAIPGVGEDVSRDAVIQIDGGGTDSMRRLKAGQSCYAGFVGETVRFYPAEKKNGAWSLRRENGRIIRYENDQAVGTVAREEEIVDFAINAEGKYILLKPEFVDFSGYGSFRLAVTGNIVEVDIRGHDVYQLTENGRVYRNRELLTVPSGIIFRKEQERIVTTLDYI